MRPVGKPYTDAADYFDKGYLVRKHLNSSDEIDYEEIVEPHQMYIKDRNTQTPIRETDNKGIQYGEEVEPLISSNKNHYIRPTRNIKKSLDIDYEEQLPFSSIKK